MKHCSHFCFLYFRICTGAFIPISILELETVRQTGTELPAKAFWDPVNQMDSEESLERNISLLIKNLNACQAEGGALNTFDKCKKYLCLVDAVLRSRYSDIAQLTLDGRHVRQFLDHCGHKSLLLVLANMWLSISQACIYIEDLGERLLQSKLKDETSFSHNIFFAQNAEEAVEAALRSLGISTELLELVRDCCSVSFIDIYDDPDETSQTSDKTFIINKEVLVRVLFVHKSLGNEHHGLMLLLGACKNVNLLYSAVVSSENSKTDDLHSLSLIISQKAVAVAAGFVYLLTDAHVQRVFASISKVFKKSLNESFGRI